MAGLLDLFSGRSSDIYGQGLLTPEQRGGLGNIGLLALAGKLGQLAGPSFSPVPDFGAALGQAAGAYGASQEGAGTAALNAILTGQKGRKLEQELDYYKQLGPVLQRAAQGWPGADGGTAATPETGSTGGGAAAPAGPGGGGTGGWGPHAETAADVFRKAGWSEAAIQGALANGLAEGGFSDPWRKAGGGENSYGHWQLNAGGELPGFQKFAGGSTDTAQQAAYVVQRLNQIAPGYGQIQDPKAATDIFATKFERYAGAAPGQRYGQLATVQQKLGGAPAAAPAPAGGGGLLAPNPLSDAESMLPIVRPRVAPQAAAGPQAAGADLLAAGMSPEMVARYLARPAPGAGTAPAAVAPALSRPGASPEDTANQILRGWSAGTDSYVTPQGPAGDVGPAGPAGPATSRAPLPTMGPAGIELPPMQGPLAAPAPAAAAPAAPGPGLLAPPGAPAAAALPRGANPAYDTYLRNLAVAGALAEGAGLKNVFGPLTDALKASPAYQAELERAKARIGVEFAGPKTTAEKTAAEPFAVAASERELKNALIKEGWQLDEKGNAVPIPNYNTVAEAKANAIAVGTEKPKLESALAQQNRRIVYDANGKPEIIPITGGAETDARAAQLKAAAEALEKSKTDLKEVQVWGPNGPEKRTMSVFEYNQRQQQARDRPATGTPQVGDIVGEPIVSKTAQTLQDKLVEEHIASRAAALTARDSIENTHVLRSKLDQGIFTGTGSNWQLGAAKLGDALGFSAMAQPDKVKATEVFIARLGQEVAATIKSAKLGPPTSDRDLAFAQAIAGGNNLNEGSIRELLDIRERYNRLAIERHNKDATGLNPRDFGGFKPTVDTPGPYKQTVGTSPSGNKWEIRP